MHWKIVSCHFGAWWWSVLHLGTCLDHEIPPKPGSPWLVDNAGKFATTDSPPNESKPGD
jgi:hypothetical protein